MTESYCSLRLKPYEWVQTIDRYPDIKVEGRRLRLKARVEPDHRLLLSSKEELSNLNVDLLIFGLDPSQVNKEPLKAGFGLFNYRESVAALATHIGGWFCLEPESYAELWNQVREGGYSDCRMELVVEPVEFIGVEWEWDVVGNFGLFITSVSIDFTRKSVFENRTKKKLGLWLHRSKFLVMNFAKLPSVPRQILKDISRPPNSASRED
jgi:hypothetical protein